MLRRPDRVAMKRSSLEILSRWAGRPAGAAVIVTLFAGAALLLLVLLRPWQTLEFSTWPSGYEAGRIARNLNNGLGYMSPFVALQGDDFLSSEPRGNSRAGTAHPEVQDATAGQWPTAWITPPYVLMWYLPFLLFGSYTVAAAAAFQVVQVGLIGTALVLAWALVRRVHGPEAAALALLFLALYPSTWYFAIEDTHGTALFVVLLLASLVTLGRVFDQNPVAGRAGRHGAVIGHGLSVALALLTEPSSLLFYVWLEGWAAWRLRRGAPRAARRLLLATALSCIAVLGPWLMRNVASLRTPVLFKSNMPMELFYGNNAEAGEDALVAHIHRFPAWSEEERLRLLQIGEPAYARLCLERALGFMKANPLATLILSVRRCVYYWSFNPDRVQPWRPLLTLIFNLMLGLWLFTTATLGWRRLDWLDRACIGFFALFPIAYYATQFMIYRYRYPVEVLLLIAAASALTRAVRVAGATLPAEPSSGPAAVR
jgi:hypothetical protein